MMPSPNVGYSSSRVGSPVGRSSNEYSTFYRSPSVSDFQIEHVAKSSAIHRPIAFAEPGFDQALAFRDNVSRLLTAKSRPFSVCGRIPFDSSQLVLFFRSKSGITHSLDFPIDVDYDTPPALDVLVAACRPHQTFDDYPDRESLFYPPNLPLTASLEIANHPILDAVRSTLFPNLPSGHYLTAMRDRLELVDNGGRMNPQPRSLRNDGRSATLIVTLPVRFRGGVLIIRDPEGREEKYSGRGGKNGDIEWTAFLPDCEYEIETVHKGCRISISYGVFLRTSGPSESNPNPLINPSEDFLDLVASTLNMSRGRKIAFYLTYDYSVNPAETLAESLVPQLKAGDSLLHHSIRLYKLNPELHWTAGGYIWPADHKVDFFGNDIAGMQTKLHTTTGRMPSAVLNGSRSVVPPIRGPFNTYSGATGDELVENLRLRAEDSGAIPLAEADISILTDWNIPNADIGRERVYFVSGGELEKLVVNVLMVVYVQ